MGTRKNIEEAEKFLRMFRNDGSLTSKEQIEAYEWFEKFYLGRARQTLFYFEEVEVKNSMTPVLESLFKTFSRKDLPDNPEAYLTTVVANGLKTLFGDKKDAARITAGKKYEKILKSLENGGRIYSNGIKVSVDNEFNQPELSEEAIYGYIYANFDDNPEIDAEFIFKVLKIINQPVEKKLLINQLVNSKKGIKIIDIPIDDDPESEKPGTEAVDTDLLPDEKLDIKWFMDDVMREIDIAANSDNKLSEEIFIQLLYLTMSKKTSKEIEKIVNMSQKNVEYYTSERANNSTRNLLRGWTNELASLLPNYSRSTILALFEDELNMRMEEKYQIYLQGIN